MAMTRGLRARSSSLAVSMSGWLVGLVRVDADRGPDVGFAFGDGEHVVPFAFASGNVEHAGHAGGAGAGQDALLILDDRVRN